MVERKPRPSNLLVVDDSSTVRKAVELSLRSSDWKLHFAGNGAEATLAAQRLQPELILLDHMMPDMSGANFCERLLGDHRTAASRIIIMAPRDADLRSFSRIYSVVDYLIKPFVPEEIVRCVNATRGRKATIPLPRGASGIRATVPAPAPMRRSSPTLLPPDGDDRDKRIIEAWLRRNIARLLGPAHIKELVAELHASPGHRLHTEAEGQNSSENFLDLGYRLCQAGNNAGAIQALRDSIRLRPDCSEAHLYLGVALDGAGQLELAIASFWTAVELSPYWPLACCNLAVALRRRGDLREAMSVLIKGLAHAPGDPQIQKELEEIMDQTIERQNPAHTAANDGNDSTAFRGDLEVVALPNVLEFFRTSRSTGELMFTSSRGVSDVRLQDGFVVEACSPRTKRLGDLLIERGLISPADLEQAQSQQSATPNLRLDEILVAQRAVEPERLAGLIEDQIRLAIQELVGWTNGHFAFRTLPVPSQEPLVKLDLQEILIDAMRRLDEEVWHSPTGGLSE